MQGKPGTGSSEICDQASVLYLTQTVTQTTQIEVSLGLHSQGVSSSIPLGTRLPRSQGTKCEQGNGYKYEGIFTRILLVPISRIKGLPCQFMRQVNHLSELDQITNNAFKLIYFLLPMFSDHSSHINNRLSQTMSNVTKNTLIINSASF